MLFRSPSASQRAAAAVLAAGAGAGAITTGASGLRVGQHSRESSSSSATSASAMAAAAAAAATSGAGGGGEAPAEMRFKVAVVGGPGVGKTTLVRRFVANTFMAETPTLGLDVFMHRIPDLRVGRRRAPVVVTFFDASHLELYGAHRDLLLEGADAVLICGDHGDFASLRTVDAWRAAVANTLGEGECVLGLVLTKADLAAQAPPDKQLYDEYVRLAGFRWWRWVSARRGRSVLDLMETLLADLMSTALERLRKGRESAELRWPGAAATLSPGALPPQSQSADLWDPRAEDEKAPLFLTSLLEQPLPAVPPLSRLTGLDAAPSSRGGLADAAREAFDAIEQQVEAFRRVLAAGASAAAGAPAAAPAAAPGPAPAASAATAASATPPAGCEELAAQLAAALRADRDYFLHFLRGGDARLAPPPPATPARRVPSPSPAARSGKPQSVSARADEGSSPLPEGGSPPLVVVLPRDEARAEAAATSQPPSPVSVATQSAHHRARTQSMGRPVASGEIEAELHARCAQWARELEALRAFAALQG